MGTHEIVEKADSQHLLCCPPFETRPCGPLLRVRFVCKLAPMGAPLQWRVLFGARTSRSASWIMSGPGGPRSGKTMTRHWSGAPPKMPARILCTWCGSD